MKHLLLTITAAVLLMGCRPIESTFFSIHDAAKDGDVDSVKKFLDQGVDINSQAGKWGNTPLHEAAFWGNVEVVRLLISKEADVDAKDYYECTPLHDAVDYGNLEILKLLLGKNTNVNAINEDGETPLDLASLKETAKLLRKHGGKTANELEAEGK
ncbi:MAG: ankyrin repeat domain-containing protein [Verrucomicrobiota bacterium]|jgi:cytohesin|nr:ankyrin repeat domain-containing protein [Verrucomicrobiota bacterium]